MKKSFFTILWVIFLINWAFAQDSTTVVLWELNNLNSIGGYPVTLIGEPQVIESDGVKAIEFDGIDDGILINNNPLSGATGFTVEVVFKPYTGGLEEQRFVHFQQDDNNRVLIETRLVDDKWFLDTFIKSGSSNKTLYAEDYKHDAGEWYHAALVYKNNVMTHYVDGVEELSGAVTYQTVTSGATSVGVRQNLVSWFKGAVKTIRVTRKALSPEEFLINLGN